MHKGTIGVASDIEWGERYRDTITGFEGVATGYCSYISGCDQVLINGGMNKDGDKVVSHWIDSDRVVKVSTGAAMDQDRGRKGADTPAPIRH